MGLMSIVQLLWFVWIEFAFAFAIDTLSLNQSIHGSQLLISDGGTFKFGFFNPPNTSRYYVGVMYNLPVLTAVWVANRERPLNGSAGTVEVSENGELVVLDGQKQIVWSSNFAGPVGIYRAKLLETGNLVLLDFSRGGTTVWESFEHATDTLLPRMKLTSDLWRNEWNMLTSWTSPSDPSHGSYTASIDPLDIPQVVIRRGGATYWRSGPWNGRTFIGIRRMISYVYQNGFNLVNDDPGAAHMTFSFNKEKISLFSLSSSGIFQGKAWSAVKGDWEVYWSSIETLCDDAYGKCGSFGICNPKSSPICSCLPGYVPRSINEWNSANWTRGCTRRTLLKCTKNSSVSEAGKKDGFLRLKAVKLPNNVRSVPLTEVFCGSECLNNCSCIAYAYNDGIGCMWWRGSLIDVQQFSTGGVDLYIRLGHSELGKKKDSTAVVVTMTVLGFIVIAIVCAFLLLNKYKGSREKCRLRQTILKDNVKGVQFEEFPLFEFQIILNATSNFDPIYKLGQGGFGPVYKGILSNGKEIAVKRLARTSNQGVEEFKNEVEVISKLQHRNLVNLLGCCIEREEKMLVYEYMPKGSLDVHLFDLHKQELLDWNKRVLIIEGISRGLLYLHRDSRLRIIHRDLKASNILLDEELNPKISDFGMARIFSVKENQANTNRVVGTYGYMAPEYALEGIISEKSDVFSFGVLLLEIVSGRRNTSFYNNKQGKSLIAYEATPCIENFLAWKMWIEGKMMQLIDPAIYEPNMESDMVRCAHVGLLCVQETAQNRPSISIVVSMLNREISELPNPMKPAFIEHHGSFSRTPGGRKPLIDQQEIFALESELGSKNAFQSINGSQLLISDGLTYKFGFFNPSNTSRYYVGVMYNFPVSTAVWVANRDRPLNDSAGTVEVSENGKLVVLDGQKQIVWSSNSTGPVGNYSATLLETGNLVLRDFSGGGTTVWESFQHATDTFLPGMKLTTNLQTNENNILTSWTSPSDPSIGSYTASVDPLEIPQIRKRWSELEKNWELRWSSLETECDAYGKCGSFGICNPKSSPICSCLPGYVPRSINEWNAANWTSGCMRRTLLQCAKNSSASEAGKQDGFLRVTTVKLPDNISSVPLTESFCGSECLSNCSCIAYAYNVGIGCMWWRESLIDVQQFFAGGVDLYIRLAHSELVKKKNWTAVVAAVTVLGFIFIAIVCVFLLLKKKKGSRDKSPLQPTILRERDAEYSRASAFKDNVEGVQFEDFPFFEFQIILNATSNFDPIYKLGQGGFGPVYKGILSNGKEIAVKRLARTSNQGVEEFKNEVEVISKLQHRNLVSLLGCCIEREEKMLVYEYMPNGSLDLYLFDSHKQELLDWNKRVLIIEGISRGLLYLHRDSRLRIIHRDLKASNILLDEELNPKISDFGMAKIFAVKEDQANTNRVVGTYGYMAPEYALEGIISDKSDVFSFGVLLLEIVSGRRNTSFYNNKKSESLIAYAWKLWTEEKMMKLIDPAIYEPKMESEMVRCAHVGLLCVQETAHNRPSISTVLSMLSREISELPHPKKPAFIEHHDSLSRRTRGVFSLNDITLTVVEGR
ncbi:G-type lectin S-receptor-like serine/threonine-protein kinase At1g11300 [Andrographis paniculata]|uniref:G-type lectin S-receptor-like serine/threonine-protein kinase At1g11300 n=1 Tax=Andrographis paniculata TaxID=175694 RepID=UPI0021E8C346|nr:G-type lectin S-receptor-like serine/threonine-protein kinase At1g11300 [Andrographis paniculata]